MPNYIRTQMRVSGSDDDIEKMINFIKSDKNDFDFNNVDPAPKQDELDSYDDLKSWKDANWGTQEAFDTIVKRTKEGVLIKFNTEWYPPIPIFINLSRKFKSLVFDIAYATDDDFHDFYGKLKMIGGVDHENSELKEGEIETYKFILETTEYGADCCVFELTMLEKEEEMKNLDLAMIEIVYEAKMFDEGLPDFVQKKLLDRAVESEDYDYAIRIRDKKNNIFAD